MKGIRFFYAAMNPRSKDRSVQVGKHPCAIIPDLLLGVRLDLELPAVDHGNSAADNPRHLTDHVLSRQWMQSVPKSWCDTSVKAVGSPSAKCLKIE